MPEENVLLNVPLKDASEEKFFLKYQMNKSCMYLLHVNDALENMQNNI